MTHVDKVADKESIPVCTRYDNALGIAERLGIRGSHFRKLRARGDTTLDDQAKMTRFVSEMKPMYEHLKGGRGYAHEVADKLGVPLLATSAGQTYQDKVGI